MSASSPTRRVWLGWRLALALALGLLLAGPTAGLTPPWSALAADTPTPVAIGLSAEVFATGLIHPRGLAYGPDGTLFVAEAGNGGPQEIDLGRQKPHTYGRTGRVSRIGQDGRRETLVDNMPSTVAAFNEELGPTALAFLGDQLYLLTVSGGWELGDPEFHSGIFRLSPGGSLERIFDYSAYTRDHPTRARLEDPRADVPLGMPYGLAALHGRLYTTDGNQEQILEIVPDGAVTRIVEYPKSNRALTGITPGPDGALYVAEHASNKITRVTPDGAIADAATKLQAPIGVAFDQAGQLYALEYYTGRLLKTAPVGQGSHQVLVSGLREPTAMAFGPDGQLYISTGGSYVGGHQNRDGQIVRVRFSQSAVTPPLATGQNPTFPIAALSTVLLLSAGLALWLRRRRAGEAAHLAG